MGRAMLEVFQEVILQVRILGSERVSISPASIGVFAPQRGWRALLLGADRQKTGGKAEVGWMMVGV